MKTNCYYCKTEIISIICFDCGEELRLRLGNSENMDITVKFRCFWELVI